MLQAFPPSLVEPLQHAAGRGLWNAYGPTDWGNAVGQREGEFCGRMNSRQLQGSHDLGHDLCIEHQRLGHIRSLWCHICRLDDSAWIHCSSIPRWDDTLQLNGSLLELGWTDEPDKTGMPGPWITFDLFCGISPSGFPTIRWFQFFNVFPHVSTKFFATLW